MVMLTQSLAMASNGIFLPISSARKLAADLDFCNKSRSNCDNVIFNLKAENSNLYKLSDEHIKKIELLAQDREIYKKQSADFKKQYDATTDKLQDCVDATPSRFTWFSGGFLSAMIVMLVSVIALK